jgi:multiple antibiotic resistance protein
MMDLLFKIVHTFIPIFVAVDIFAIVPIFISLTEGLSRQDIKKIERESVFTAFAVGIIFIALGEGIFSILGITANDFKIAGGIILLILAVLELTGYTSIRRQSGSTGVVPLGVPLIVGPAVLTTILVLVDHYGILPTIISFIANLVIVLLSFNASERLISLFGRGGIAAISKIMALLLASIAVMMIRIGIENLMIGRQ